MASPFSRLAHPLRHRLHLRWRGPERRHFRLPGHHRVPPRHGQPSPCSYYELRCQRGRDLGGCCRVRCLVAELEAKTHPASGRFATRTCNLAPAVPPSCSRAVMVVWPARRRRAALHSSLPPSPLDALSKPRLSASSHTPLIVCFSMTSVGATSGYPEVAADFSSGGFSNIFSTYVPSNLRETGI